MALETVHELFDFIENSPSCFHVIDNVKAELKKEGFEELCENKKWEIKEGGKYFVTRNLSSVIAFKVPTKDFKSFQPYGQATVIPQHSKLKIIRSSLSKANTFSSTPSVTAA